MNKTHQPGRKDKVGDREKRKKGVSEFDKLPIPKEILAGIHDLGFEKMTPIQSRALPITLAGNDITGQAQTGTGKTCAFIVTIFSRLFDKIDPERTEPLALVLAPTRELAIQIHREAVAIGKESKMRMAVVYGGAGYTSQEKKLAAGIDLLIGTPGRLLDFARQRKVDLSKVEVLVIDEADRLLDMGFADELRAILRLLPPPKKRQSMMFSATLDHKTKDIANGYMNRPEDVAIRPESITVDNIEEMVFHVDRNQKIPLLLGLMSKQEVVKGLIFANMKIRAAYITEKLRQNGYTVELLTGDLPQNKRMQVLDRFSQGEIPLLVASDVASRGLHIDDVTHIFNFDVPQDPEDYVHRIGRTARAGKTGVAYTLACDEYVYHLDDIERFLDRRLPFRIPDDDEFGEDKAPQLSYEQFRRQNRKRRPAGDFAKGGGGRGRRPSAGGSRRSSSDRSSRSRRNSSSRRGPNSS